MKKLLLSLLGVFLTGLSATAENQAITGWGSKNNSYGTYTSENQWVAANSCLVEFNSTVCPTLNGKTTAVGTLTSPKLSGGIGSLTIQAANTYSESKGISLKAEIKQGETTVASQNFTVASIDQKTESTFEPWNNINIAGDFTIVITNLSPSNSTSNKDRASITTLTWTNYEVNPNAPKDVEMSYALNEATAKVTLSCETEGATIFYGFSNDEITTEYTAPFDVTENCTVYAFAQKGEDKGNTTSLDIVVPYTSFRDVVTKAQDGEELSVIGNFSVIYKATVGKTTNVILTDGVSNLLIFSPSEAPELGTKISKIEGSATIYQGLIEIASGATLTEGGEGAEYSAKQINTLAGLTKENNLFDQVIIDGCTMTGNSTNGYTVNFGTEEISLYNRYQLSFINNKSYKMSAFVWYSSTRGLQLVPYSLEDGTVKETVMAPVITPNKRELVDDDKVTITCETEGAKIYYTLDGSDPTQESTLYTAPFAITKDVIVKARAFYEGDGDEMLPSEIISKEYHLYDPYCNVITNSHDSEDEGNFSTYTAHVDKIDGVDYALFGMHDKEKGMQMNYQPKTANKAERFCYIIQTSDNEGLSIKSIVVDFNDNAKNITFTVRGSNTPFIAEDKDNITTSGDLIGTIDATTTSIEFKKDYNYFAFYPTPSSSNQGAVYMNSVTINYRDPAAADESEINARWDEVENFEIISGEEGLLTSELPTHENWITKYKVNGGEETEYDPEEGGIYIESVPAATLHTITIWHEHYYHGTKTEEHVFNHMTQPGFNIDNDAMSFGELGEGVKVYFTIDGTDPVIETAAAANAPRRAKSNETENTYVINEDADATATHVISKSNTIVTVANTVAQAVNINAKAVHEATGTVSEAVKKSGVTTSIVNIEANSAAKTAYDLMGRKVAKPANGLYIINGQKVRL